MKTGVVFLSLVIALFWAIAAYAKGGSEAGNGGGLAEKNLVFAQMSLGKYVGLCLESGLCRLSDREREILKAIRDALPREETTKIIFDSEKKHPGFFMIDGQVRVAKTGDHVGDPVYVNTDLIYYPVKGEQRAIDIPVSASILVHELGHHQGIKDHAALDVLGSKVQALLLTQSQRAEFWNGNAALITFQLNTVRRDEDKKHIGATDQVLLENDWDGGSELVSLTDRILQAIHCPPKKEKIAGLRIYNVHEERGVRFDKKTRILRKPIQGWYIVSCAPGEESDHGNVEMQLAFQKLADGSFRFKPELTSVSQISCLKDVRVCK